MASGTATYKRIIQILEKWPIDKNKSAGRDLGDYLRKSFNQAYKDNKFETNHRYWDREYLAIQNIVNNNYKNKYKRILSSSATGLTAEQCNIVLSDEVLKELREEEKSFFRKLISLKPSFNWKEK